jgi:adenine deaminase
MSHNTYTISGQIVDLHQSEIFPGTIIVENGKITHIEKTASAPDHFILPGLIDAHVHIESSMLVPSEFARLAVVHGTVATVSDPHEIANVLGIAGVDYMVENGKTVPFKFYFGAPSCVPATAFESSGADLGPDDMEKLLTRPEIKYMAEMMNYPGVIYQDEMVMQKLGVAKKHNKPIDGHAPGLKGEDARKYIEAGISTDHECFTMEEALDKIKYGMKIQIREGSAAKNFDALIGLLDTHPERVLFCSDDKHPNDLLRGHINLLVKRAIALGYDPLLVLRTCIVNPIEHYKLDVGMLQTDDDADFIIVDNLEDFNILESYSRGQLIARNGKTLIESVKESEPNIFRAEKITPADIEVLARSAKIKVIKALDGELITEKMEVEPAIAEGKIVSDVGRDILKIVVMNRYKQSEPAIGFIHGFGIKQGAIASTVAHDSHNIIALGIKDEDIAKAVNHLIDARGGIAIVDGNENHVMPLPVAGLMSAGDGYATAAAYQKMDALAKTLGSTLKAPFMTLSFMALLVIPHLKLSDKGLFDGDKFAFTQLAS